MGRPFRCAAPVLAAALVLGNLSVRPAAAVGPRPQRGHRRRRPVRGQRRPQQQQHPPAATVPFGMLQLGGHHRRRRPRRRPRPGPGTPRPTTLVGGSPPPTPARAAGFRRTLLPVPGAVPDHLSAATTELVRSSERATPGRYAVALGNGVPRGPGCQQPGGTSPASRIPPAKAFALVRDRGAVSFPPTTRSPYAPWAAGSAAGTTGTSCTCSTASTVPSARAAWRRTAPGVELRAQRVVRAQVAISYVDPTGARRNLDLERPGWSVSRLAARTTGSGGPSSAGSR